VYELLEMTTTLIEAANQQDPSYFIQAAKKQVGRETMRRRAVELAVAGKTTIAEAMRISNEFEN
jgi:MSHA biogenesis protein MshE